MHKCIQKILLAACIVAMPVTTHAGPIDPGNGYTRDDASVVVQGFGLEWLQWSETVGQSIDSALLLYASKGWRLATSIEMADLFNAFSVGSPFTGREKTQTVSSVWLPGETGFQQDFFTIFGRTGFVPNDNFNSDDPYEQSSAFFGVASCEGKCVWTASVVDDRTRINTQNDSPVFEDGSTQLYYDDGATTRSFGNIGIALVRSVSVPEPGTFALLSLGLLGLGLNRRIHRKTL
jgi:hypothetical protein